MSVELAAVIAGALAVVYGILSARSGLRGRPRGPFVV
jgi:hypothetical protein